MNINNERQKIIPSGFKRYEYCLPSEQVNVQEDLIQLHSSNNDGVCIFGLFLNKIQILVGPENNQTMFWIDQDALKCGSRRVATSQITIRNGRVISSICKGLYYFIIHFCYLLLYINCIFCLFLYLVYINHIFCIY